MREALTFDDVQIVPVYSEVISRNDVSLKTQFTKNYEIEFPLIAAPMDTVCDLEMAWQLYRLGCVGVIHRFMEIEEQSDTVSQLVQSIKDDISLNGKHQPNRKLIVAAAIGANGDLEERSKKLLKKGCNILVIDVAHGHHIHVKKAVKFLTELKKDFQFDIVAGSIATPQAALDLQEWGADALRVGVGGGSVCETRIRTGIGVPQLEAVMNVVQIANIPVISDGGIRYPGDVAKALAAGAGTVMIGSLFAGTDEAPGEVFISGQWPNNKSMKIYRGLASETTKLKYSGAASHVEGASKMIESKGPVLNIVSDILDGVKSSMSYVGASNLEDFRKNSNFIKITSSGLSEAHPHLLSR